MTSFFSNAADALKEMSEKGSKSTELGEDSKKELKRMEVERAGTFHQVSSIYQSDVEKVPKQSHHQKKESKAAPSKSEDEVKHEKELRRLRRSHPLGRVVNRKCSAPLLGMSAKGTNYRGIVNLMCLLLVALNLRLVLENLIKYGILLRPWEYLSINNLRHHLPLVYTLVLVLCCPALSYVIERYIAPGQKDRRLANTLQLSVLLAVLIGPLYTIETTSPHGLLAMGLLCCSVTYAMKIVSYWHVCHDLFWSVKKNKLEMLLADEKETLEVARKYPRCLSLKDMYMFIAYPTLCYQLWYPRYPHRNWMRLLKYTALLLFCLALQLIIMQQYMLPILLNARIMLMDSKSWRESVLIVAERVLKLAVPNLYCWLLMFFTLFHTWMNILAELTRFGDREFYLDWWNSVSFREYWQKWNLPVHYFILRHMYVPARRFGCSQDVAGMLCFVFSGVLHEYVSMIPFGLPFYTLVTQMFISQVPLMVLTDKKFIRDRPNLGSCIFWITFCFTGQPAAMMVFFLLKYM
ncbi:Diacylglycerol O-acyltransferase 1 [Perkinsus olseni]|uniref:O-acyltransferase n=1 Tax=Perkinsus olseni TaxID=32597 RepID=A0A7J6TIZ5_PEROL|nr:Diacylglycerol O-acyltransferase 1 [Perkinsus olseni]KAF4744817.1 Diacylglycerol O-acyltransferase 1 [Perkinsus olseni]